MRVLQGVLLRRVLSRMPNKEHVLLSQTRPYTDTPCSLSLEKYTIIGSKLVLMLNILKFEKVLRAFKANYNHIINPLC